MSGPMRRFFFKFVPKAIADPTAGAAARGAPALIGCGGHVVGDASDGGCGNAGSSAPTQTGKEMTPEDNAQCRKKAYDWTRQKPFDRMVRCRVAVDALSTFLHEVHWGGSLRNELSQRAAVAKAMRDGSPLSGSRTYRLTEVSTLKRNDTFATTAVQHMTNTAIWATVPMRDRTKAFRDTTFRVFVRSLCAIEWYSTRHARLPPHPLYLLLSHNLSPAQKEVLRSEITNTCAELCDSFTLRMRTDHPTLDGPDFTAKLKSEAQNGFTDIGGVEAGWGIIRRMAVARGQGIKLGILDLGALWIGRQMQTAPEDLAPMLVREKRRTAVRFKRGGAAKKVMCTMIA